MRSAASDALNEQGDQIGLRYLFSAQCLPQIEDFLGRFYLRQCIHWI